MAGTSLSIVRSASQQLAFLLVEEAKFLYSVNEKMETLQLHLECIQCFLEDAEKNDYNSQLISRWIFQIREFTYEAENIIDKFAVRVFRQHREEGIWNTIKWFSCIAPDVKSLHEVGSDIDTLSRRIAKLTSIMQLCGLKVDVTKNSNMVDTQLEEARKTTSQIEEDEFLVGFDEDVSDLVYQLVNTDKKVVAISGMGGLGKTTLAKMVCNNNTIKQHFDDGFVWVFISQQFVALNVIEQIWKQLCGDGMVDTDHTPTTIQFCEKVKKKLQNNNYLVVLDDIWNEESWERLRDAFPPIEQSSSKLLLTTRNLELLKHVDEHNGYLHQPSCLTTEQSWELLKNIVSRGRYHIDAEMERLGKEMIKQHCKCLPLAITTLGGVLRSKKTIEKWKVVNDNVYSYLTAGEGSTVMQVLQLSYKELPFYLRPCFLYLANFPENFEIDANSLYHMWIAEGLVMPPSDEDVVSLGETRISMEDMAQKYVVETGETGMIQSCHVHDIIRDMCIKKAKEENFFNIATGKKMWDVESNALLSYSSKVSACRPHRLVFLLDDGDDTSSSDCGRHRNIRALFIYTSKGKVSTSCRLRALIETSPMLRLLHLHNTDIVSLPKEIGKLINLRYLSLFGSYVTSERLPSLLGTLVHLECLDLRVRDLITIPNVLWKLRRLRHLYLPELYIVKKINEKLEVQGLTHLKTLENLDLSSCRYDGDVKLKELTKFTWQSLIFHATDKKSLEILLAIHATSSTLSSQKSLCIDLDWDMLRSEEYANKIAKLPAYELCVRRLGIVGDLKYQSLDSIKILLQHLTSLSLSTTYLRYDPMPFLERLSNLEELWLGNNSISVRQISCSAGGFPQLTSLKLSDIIMLEKWEIEGGSMPKLRYLEILYCSALKQLPDVLVGTRVDIRCISPCISGIEKHGTCPYFEGWKRIQLSNEEGLEEAETASSFN